MLGERFSESTVFRRRVALARDLADHGANVAIVTDDTTLTYAELAERVDDVALQLGATRRLVMVEAENTLGAVVAYLGALAGGHAVMLVPAADGLVRERLLTAYDPDVICWSGPHAPLLDERRRDSAHELHPDLALLLSTSGSMGSPKLVRLSAENLDANAAAIASYLDLRADDCAATALPMSYCYGLSVINSHLAVGASLLLQDASVVDPEFWDRFRDASATSFAGVPYTFELLDRVGFDTMELPSLRYVTQAGGRLPPEQVRRYAQLGTERGWQLFVMYGQTEATARMAFLPPELAATHPDAIGIPVPGGAFEIASDAAGDDDAEGGNEGELIYRGPNVMLGYATARDDLALGRTTDALPTGDIARRTADGLYEIVGRKSRFVKPYGVRIDLDAIEALLREQSIDAAVTGDDHGLAIAVCAPVDVTLAADAVHHETTLPRSCVHVRRYDALPRLDNGKPDYAVIHTDCDAGPARAEPRDVRAVLAAVLHREVVRDDDSFVSLGGDSLSYVEAALLLETVVGDLPGRWHEMTVAQLSAVRSRPRRRPRMEMNIVLRAVAIFLVVADHVLWIPFQGGAHVLLLLAGFNYARFGLLPDDERRVARAFSHIGRIFVPTAIALALTLAFVNYPGIGRRVFLSAYLDDGIWRYWFIETMVHILLVLVVLFSVRAIRNLERRHPFAFPLVLCAVLAAISFAHITFGDPSFPAYETHLIAWMFVLGWLAARADTTAHRLVVTVAGLALLPWFDRPSRGMIVFGGLVILVWVRHVRLPVLVHRAITVVAAASLYIYLVHFEIFRPLLFKIPAPWIVALSFAAGIVTWLLLRVAARAFHRLRSARPLAANPAAAGTLTW